MSERIRGGYDDALYKSTFTTYYYQPGDLVTSVCFCSHVSMANSLMLLIKASAMVAVYKGHCRTLLRARD